MRACLLAFLLLLPVTALAQADTIFWFAAPEISAHVGGLGSNDRPILLRVSTAGQAAVLTIRQPANPLFLPITQAIPAYQTITIDLTPFIDQLESRPADQILNTGLHITATAPVTAYYEVDSQCGCNPEIFVLKGRNALGTAFFTPFQTTFNNAAAYTPTPYASFDIVASENATRVTITPSQPLQGHPANVAFTVILDQGQVYSAVAASQVAAAHPNGSRVVASKPVAITIKDDLVRSLNGCSGSDLMGDQLIPVARVGTDYILIKGELNGEHATITATANATSVYVDGSTNLVATINAGQSYHFNLVNPSAYIRTDKPAYVLHVTGKDCELAGAVLPPLDCSGSQDLSFTRANTDDFRLHLLVRAGSEADFILNGSSTLIQATDFTAVPGTNGQWKVARLAFNLATISVNSTSRIRNTSSVFHLALLNGRSGSIGGGFRFGYFSNFNTLAFSLGSDQEVCPGERTVLAPGISGGTYQWSTGATTPTLTVGAPGTYWVTVAKDGCTATDTIQLTPATPLGVLLGPDTSVCAFPFLIEAANDSVVKTWPDNSTGDSYLVNAPGTYWVEGTNAAGCAQTDSITIAAAACDFFIPNIITPNGDDRNNIFFLTGLIPADWRLTIFNRWGAKVFATDAYDNQWSGADVASGVYYYYLQSRITSSSYKGWLEVIH